MKKKKRYEQRLAELERILPSFMKRLYENDVVVKNYLNLYLHSNMKGEDTLLRIMFHCVDSLVALKDKNMQEKHT